MQRLRPVAALALAIVLGSCQDQPPTAPMIREVEPTPELPAQAPGPEHLFSPLARQIPATSILESTADELARGRYRYRLGRDTMPDIARDEFIVGTTSDGKSFVRRVLSAARSGDEIVVETGPAYWHEVIQSGTYGITVPLARNAPAKLRSGDVLPILQITPAGGSNVQLGVGPMSDTVPPLTQHFDNTDICAWINDLPDIGEFGNICDGEFHDIEKGTGFNVKLSGRIDTLKITTGSITLSGDVDIDLQVETGGISGGTPPTFYPCNVGNYPGCITTPTGAAFVEWIRQYVPELPEASLRPVRVCVPGLPVRVKAGYWDYSGFVPVWRLPTFKQCRMTSVGVLPTVTLPAVSHATSHFKPHVNADMTVRFVGDGILKLMVPFPGAGYSKVFSKGSGIKAKAEVGLFFELAVTAKNGGLSLTYASDRITEVAQNWTPQAGWSGAHDVVKSDRHIALHDITIPDSLVVRFGGLASAGIEVCFAFTVCEVSGSDLEDQDEAKKKIEAKATARVEAFFESTWNREPVHPTDPTIDNWHLSTDYAYDLVLGAELKIPFTNWILPDVPRSWDDTLECCRLRINDMYGVGMVNVAATTTGVSPDPDGYQVQLQRMDTLPVVLDAGTSRIGKARDHGTPLQLDLPSTGNVTFGKAFALPCGVWYSDAALLLVNSPPLTLFVGGLRGAGVAIPIYAMAGFCDLLIGRYQVTLTGVASNCTVVGGPVRNDVWLLQSNAQIGRHSNLTNVAFEVQCGAVGDVGSIAVTTDAVTSPDFAQDYGITIDGASQGLIGPSAARTLTMLPAGTHTVALTGGPSNCELPSGMDVDVSVATPAAAAFHVQCTLPPGAIGIEATTVGTAEGMHQLILDGIPGASVPLNGLGIGTGLQASMPAVVYIAPAASNCRTTSLNPFIVIPNASNDPLTVQAALECTSGDVREVDGVVESSADPTQPVRLRGTDGEVNALTGPFRDQLAQLGGVQVRVRAELRGTSLSVFGFDIVPATDEQASIGVVAQRDGDWWLLGESAVRLFSPPAAITSRPGDLMWVSGTPSGDAVTPRLFGTLRRVP